MYVFCIYVFSIFYWNSSNYYNLDQQLDVFCKLSSYSLHSHVPWLCGRSFQDFKEAKQLLLQARAIEETVVILDSDGVSANATLHYVTLS